MKKKFILGLVFIIIFAFSACSGISAERLGVLKEADDVFIKVATNSMETMQIVIESVNLYKDHELKTVALENIEKTIEIQSESINMVQDIDVPELQNYKEYLLGVL